MKKVNLFNWIILFEFKLKKKKGEKPLVKRNGYTHVLSVTQEEACVAFHDMIKKDKVWKEYEVIINLCKLNIGKINLEEDGTKKE